MTGPEDSGVIGPRTSVDADVVVALAAAWIGTDESAIDPPGQRPVFLLRRRSTQRPRSGHRRHLTITAHGIAEVFLNGSRVGDDELTPRLQRLPQATPGAPLRALHGRVGLAQGVEVTVAPAARAPRPRRSRLPAGRDPAHPPCRSAARRHPSADRQGPIDVSWRLDDAGGFHLDLDLPSTTAATVVLPDGTTHEVGGGSHQLFCTYHPEVSGSTAAGSASRDDRHG